MLKDRLTAWIWNHRDKDRITVTEQKNKLKDLV